MRRIPILVCVVALIWFGAIIGFWATRPIHDDVPTGMVNSVYTSQSVRCADPLSGSSGQPVVLPTLGTVPTNTGPLQLTYLREPCERPHSQARLLLLFDTGLLVLVLAGAFAVPIVVSRRRLRPALT